MLPSDKTRTEARLPTPGGRAVDRIALVTPYFWPEVRRGTERLVHDLANGLSDAGRSPLVVTGHPGRTAHTFEDGIEIHRARRLPGAVPRLFGYPEPLGQLTGIARKLRAARPAVAHAFGAYEAVAAQLATKRHGTTQVLTVTGIPQRAVVEGRLWRRLSVARAVEGSDAVIVLGEAARRALGWLGGNQVVIAPGVDLRTFRRTRDRSEVPTVVCTAAMDDPRKRVGLAVEAFTEVRTRWPDARLILSHRGVDRAVARLPGIEIRDLDDPRRLVDSYSEAWATVLPSYAEAFGLIAVESLACGTPVAASADAGVREAVGGEGPHACLFLEATAPVVARAMIQAMEASGAVETETACRRQAERFSLERCVRSHLRLYQHLGR